MHPCTPASASDAPISCKNCRRVAPSCSRSAYSGNSRRNGDEELVVVGKLFQAPPELLVILRTRSNDVRADVDFWS